MGSERNCCNSTLKLACALAGITLGAGLMTSSALTQALSPPVIDGEVSTPVEITLNTINSQVQCGPRRVRLPARDPLDLRVVNQSEAPIMFAAPEFFKATRHIETAGFVMDVVKGGFLVAPQSTAKVVMRTPRSGEYYFSCFYPDRVPTPESSGFLIVVPAAS